MSFPSDSRLPEQVEKKYPPPTSLELQCEIQLERNPTTERIPTWTGTVDSIGSMGVGTGVVQFESAARAASRGRMNATSAPCTRRGPGTRGPPETWL